MLTRWESWQNKGLAPGNSGAGFAGGDLVADNGIHFKGSGGTRLAARLWAPAGPPCGLVAVVHGVTEHSGRYEGMAARLTHAGFAVAACDLRGHGASEGPRGHLERWEDFSSDLTFFLEWLNSRFPGLPQVLYGHSLGALIALACVQTCRPRLAGLVISGAALEPSGIAKLHLVLVARSLNWVWPRLRIPLPTPPFPTLSRDPDIEAEFRRDPRVLRHVTARFGTQALAMILEVKRRAADVRLPLLALHGGADRVCLPGGVERFFEKVPSEDKRLIIYPGGLHEPHQDIDRERVFEDLRAWLEERLPRRATAELR